MACEDFGRVLVLLGALLCVLGGISIRVARRREQAAAKAERRRERQARLFEAAILELQAEARALGLTLRSLLPEAQLAQRRRSEREHRGDE